MKVILDTNIFISGIFWKGDCNKIILAWKNRKFSLFTSKEIIYELVKVLKDFKIQMNEELIREWIKLIVNNSTVIEPKIKLNIIKEDESDNRFLECALEGNVNCIISQDKHLLKLKKINNINILKPGEFLRLI